VSRTKIRRIKQFEFEFGPKVKKNKQASEKVEKFCIKFRRSVNAALYVGCGPTQFVVDLI